MESIEALITLVKDLPNMALWVLVLFFGYKVVIVGSIYGVIKFCVKNICDAIEKWRKPKDSFRYAMEELEQEWEKVRVAKKEFDTYMNAHCIASDTTTILLTAQLNRVKSTSYLHEDDVALIEEGLDLLVEKYGENLRDYRVRKQIIGKVKL